MLGDRSYRSLYPETVTLFATKIFPSQMSEARDLKRTHNHIHLGSIVTAIRAALNKCKAVGIIITVAGGIIMAKGAT